MMVSAGGPSSSPGLGHCVVFLGKTQLSQCLSPSRGISGCGKGVGQLWDGLASHPQKD